MFIIPLSNTISWKNPPYITILIVLINCYVLFGIQTDDNKTSMEMVYDYFESGLAEIELFQYAEYVEQHNDGAADLSGLRSVHFENVYEEGFEALDMHEQMLLLEYYGRMRSDDEFMQQLQQERIITPDDERYAEWRELRDHHESKQQEIVSWKYGFIPAEAEWVTAFTYMFLHGGFGHLLGNMILLWLVGCILEVGCGRVAYLVIYLVSGLGSAALFHLCYMDSTVPLVGASGAISGAVAAYTILFGKKKLKIFYSLGFYFNYTKVPGYAVLPVWIGNEIYQLWSYGDLSTVAYVAHLGGLMTGGILGFIIIRLLHQVDESVLEEKAQDKASMLLDEAYTYMSNLDTGKARDRVKEVLAMDAGNRAALLLLFNIDKLDPHSSHFHETAARVLTHLAYDGQAYNLLFDTYKEYCRVAKPPRFTSDLLYTITSVFLEHDYIETAEPMVKFLVSKRPRYQHVPIALMKLSRSLVKNGQQQEGKKYLQILCKRYPDTEEAKTAVRLLKA